MEVAATSTLYRGLSQESSHICPQVSALLVFPDYCDKEGRAGELQANPATLHSNTEMHGGFVDSTSIPGRMKPILSTQNPFYLKYTLHP